MNKLTIEQRDWLIEQIKSNDNTRIDVYLADNPHAACIQGVDAMIKKIIRILSQCTEDNTDNSSCEELK